MKEIFTDVRVKKDLRNIKYFNNSVRIYEKASKYFKKQYEIAKSNNMLTPAEIKELESCIRLIDSNVYIGQSLALKERYLREISRLDDFTRAIIIDAFINDCGYIEIARKMYCSPETVKRRVKSGINTLVERMNEEYIPDSDEQADKIKININKK